MEEYIVFVTWYDEISTLVLDASSEEDAVAQAKEAMVRLARERASQWSRTPAEIEEYAAGYLRDDYRASRTNKPCFLGTDPELFLRWREPVLPSACPSGYY